MVGKGNYELWTEVRDQACGLKSTNLEWNWTFAIRPLSSITCSVCIFKPFVLFTNYLFHTKYQLSCPPYWWGWAMGFSTEPGHRSRHPHAPTHSPSPNPTATPPWHQPQNWSLIMWHRIQSIFTPVWPEFVLWTVPSLIWWWSEVEEGSKSTRRITDAISCWISYLHLQNVDTCGKSHQDSDIIQNVWKDIITT